MRWGQVLWMGLGKIQQRRGLVKNQTAGAGAVTWKTKPLRAVPVSIYTLV